MRLRVFVLLVGFSGFCVLSHGAPFTDSLSDGEMKMAGLDRLTPAERGVLDGLIALYQEGRLEEARADAAREATEEMEARVAEVREVAAIEAVKAYEAKLEAEKRFMAVVEGTFRGWSGRTRFPLDNGQVWMQKRDAK